MTQAHSLALGLVVLYALAAPPLFYVTVRHGVFNRNFIGWGFMIAFVTLKIVGSAMQLSQPSSSGAIIVGSIGLSPLLFATEGIVHEARRLRIPPSTERLPFNHRFLRILIAVKFHMLVAGGIALVAVGASGLASTDATTTQADIDSDWTLATIGAALLVAAWLLVSAQAVAEWFLPVRSGGSSRAALAGDGAAKLENGHAHGSDGPAAHARGAGTTLLAAVLVALPLLGIRVATSLAYFVSKDQRLSPASGTVDGVGVGMRVGLELLEELLVTILFVGAGVVTAGAVARWRKATK